jgi:hypothetical protein
MPTTTADRTASVEEYVRREALAKLVGTLAGSNWYSCRIDDKMLEDLFGPGFQPGEVCNDLSGPLSETLWPNEGEPYGRETIDGAEYNIAEARAALIAARILAAWAARPGALEEAVVEITRMALDDLARAFRRVE